MNACVHATAASLHASSSFWETFLFLYRELGYQSSPNVCALMFHESKTIKRVLVSGVRPSEVLISFLQCDVAALFPQDEGVLTVAFRSTMVVAVIFRKRTIWPAGTTPSASRELSLRDVILRTI